MAKKCLIISGGEFHPYYAQNYSYVIACDSGYAYCEKLNIVPDCIIGDFDSLDPSIPIPDQAIVHPVRKDDTDTMLAARHAIEMGFTDITIICAMGGRFDHTLANIQTAAFIVSHGGICCVMGKDAILTCFRNSSLSFSEREGYSFSVFSLSDASYGVSIQNASYTAENITLTNAFPLACSNHWASGPISVSVKDGMLLVVEAHDA